jgi:exopolysaccharide production protein ExoZ
MKNKNLDIIQIYRGIAAFMVAIFHLWIHLAHAFIEYSCITKFTAIGAYGVDFFFVLSGFIISYSYLDKKISIYKYLSNRYLRIYLPYIPLGILFAIGYTIFTDLSFEGGVNFSWLATLTLLPVGNTSLVVAWSLIHEIIFYFVFIIAIINYKKYNIFLIIWSILIIIYNYFNLKTDIYALDFIFYKFFHLYNFEFMLGYICFLVIDKIKNKNLSLFMIFAFCMLFSLIFFYIENKFWAKFSYSMLSFWLIIFAYQKRDIIISKNNFFMKMGNYSYSLYLIHIPVQIVFFRVFPQENVWISMLVCILITLFVSYIYSQIFENKLLYFLKSKFKI